MPPKSISEHVIFWGGMPPDPLADCALHNIANRNKRHTLAGYADNSEYVWPPQYKTSPAPMNQHIH